MRKICLTFGASALVLASFTSSWAADAVVHDIQRSVPSVPSSSPLMGSGNYGSNWSGAYAGLSGQWVGGRFKSDADKKDTKRQNGAGAAVYGGYNFQYNAFIYGLEGDLGYAKLRVKSKDNKSEFKKEINGSLRVRLGYTVTDSLITYVTGGVSVANRSLQNLPKDDNDKASKKIGAGYTVGAGVEMLVADNVTARLEYRYTDIGKKNPFKKKDKSPFVRGYDESAVTAGIGVLF